jgi:predicted TIM-barrel fold metal-dependent hydrolase
MNTNPCEIVDCHNHLVCVEDLDVLGEAAARASLGGFTVLSLPVTSPAQTDSLALACQAKRRYPDRAYIYGAWDHSARFLSPPRPVPPLAAQVREQAAMGVDGWKILESKPDLRRRMGEPLDGPYFAPGFAALEALDLPVLWHVADPETFWDPATTPAWALAHNWGYGPDFPAKESLHAEVERVLARHPRLRVVFAHFCFLSADLGRATRFLAAHPRVGLDLAPGIELLYNLSRDRDRARDFFVAHADRIYFGTDAGLLRQASAVSVEARIRLVLRFLSTGDTFRVPADADFLLGPPEDGCIRGLDLPAPVQQRILAANQREQVGPRPRPLDPTRVAAASAAIACHLPGGSLAPASSHRD